VNIPPLTWLYVPADRPDRVEKAIASAAHAVIVDLEDGVAPGAKLEARANLPPLLAEPRDKPVYVRVNSLRTGLAEADLEVVATLAVTGIVVPKVDGPADVAAVLTMLPAPERLHCLLESAAAVEAAYAIASEPAVAGISLGEADLRSETGALEEGVDWARARIVNAAVAAGLPRPPQSVYPRLRDDEGLARSCSRGRALGHLGRAAIHPEQLPIIEQAYLPTPQDGGAPRGPRRRHPRERRVRRRGDARRSAAGARARRALRYGCAVVHGEKRCREAAPWATSRIAVAVRRGPS
jgi:citrate lyase subunit beta/citryl-CoA lyase